MYVVRDIPLCLGRIYWHGREGRVTEKGGREKKENGRLLLIFGSYEEEMNIRNDSKQAKRSNTAVR